MTEVKKPPFTGWITKPIKAGEWLNQQVKRNAGIINENYLWNYMDGNLHQEDPSYETAKIAFQKIERNWRTKQSRKGKKVITISAESQRRIEQYRKQSGKTAIEVIDELTSQLEGPSNKNAPLPPLSASMISLKNSFQGAHNDTYNTYTPGDPLI